MQTGIVVKNKKIYFGGESVEDLIRRYGSPVFVFSEDRLYDNFATFEKAFKDRYPKTYIYYSIKTNFEVQILKSLKKFGSLGEIASGLELIIAEKAGFKASELVADGPSWTDDDIKLFIKKGVSVLNLDSLELMHRVNRIAKKLNKKVKVSFRIFPELKVSLLKSFIERYIAKFGIPISQAIDAYQQLGKMDYLVPIAISSHIGSMLTDPAYYEHSVDRLVKLAADLRDQLGIDIEQINIGGGFGVQSLNYFSIESVILSKVGVSAYRKAASIDEFAKRITSRFSKNLKKYNLPELDLILEPGRFVVSDVGILLTQVISVKDKWIFINGGVNILPESIFFVRRGFIVANKVGRKADHTYNIAGPTLSTGDVVATEQKMPKLEKGDIVVVLDAGAYTLPRSNQFTVLRPDVLYITTDKKIKYLRKKEEYSDLVDKLLE